VTGILLALYIVFI